MSYVFRPPARDESARLTADHRRRPNDPETRLGRYIRTGRRPVNVWRLVDGTYREATPDPTVDPAVDRWFQGGAANPVTAAEAAALVAAGYTVDGWSPDDDTTPGVLVGAGYGTGAYAALAYGGSN